MNTGYRNTGHMNTGDRNTGDWNAGDWNTGHRNTGHRNTGNRNTGHRNAGDKNTGDWNTGDRNTGDRNTGDWNTGDRNTGHMNTGHMNTGDRNTGDWNTGHMNTGNMNTGNMNTGNWNACNYEIGCFNTISRKVIRVFNRDCDMELWENSKKPNFLCFNLTEWIHEENMTEKEKEENESYKTTGGYLRKYDYKQAFKKSYNSLTKEEREEQVKQLKALPNFDKDVFFEISGIDIDQDSKKMIVIDGIEILISEEFFYELKKKFLD